MTGQTGQTMERVTVEQNSAVLRVKVRETNNRPKEYVT
jgi:hypothetical protein